MAIVLGLIVLPQHAASAQQDARYFGDTGFRIDDDKIWDYFVKRGGSRAFGLPISRTFAFQGAPSQFFRRHVLQSTADGVRTLSLLDEGILPYTVINGSILPGADPAIAGAAPKPGAADYGSAASAFLKQNAPDTFEGEPVNYYTTYMQTVTMADAFPEGNGNADLLPLFTYEIWGLPTSKPTRDPGNTSVIYLRFQKGILKYDTATGTTEWLPLGDVLKSLITGQDLPDDLAAQASASGLLRQYDPDAHTGPLHAGLPRGTELGNAFRPSLDSAPAAAAPLIVSDPSGSSGSPSSGQSQAPAPESKPQASAPKPTAAPSGPPDGDPSIFLIKLNEAGKNAKEQDKEAKKGSDNQMVWASNRFERDATYANQRSGPTTVYSRAIIARDSDTAHQIFQDEVKQNQKFPEAKEKIGGIFEFNTEGNEDVGEEAAGQSACVASGCNAKDDANMLHRRIVFRVGPYVGVVYTFGLDDPEGNTQAYTRRLAAIITKHMRDAL